MTSKEIEKAMERKNPNLYTIYKTTGHIDRVSLLTKIGLDLWLTQTPEDEDTKTIREAILHLHKVGTLPQ